MPQQSSNRTAVKQKLIIPERKFNRLALGGTFDHFHKGHRFFLKEAFRISENVVIGITDDKLAQKIHNNRRLQSFEERKRKLLSFLKSCSLENRAKIIRLHNLFGPTASDSSLEALLVTKNTILGGQEINKIRQQKKLSPLKLIIIKLIKAEDQKIIASRRIRKGEINREGIHYSSRLFTPNTLEIPKKLRAEFRKPFGKTFPAKKKNIHDAILNTTEYIQKEDLKPIISVGDLVTHSLLKIKIIPHLSIIDFHVQRKRKYLSLSQIGPIEHLPRHTTSNPPGSISWKLSKLIDESIKKEKPSVIEVKGEEDLAVLPCVLLAPLKAVVLYGHFQFGVVAVEINEEKKSEALKLLKRILKI